MMEDVKVEAFDENWVSVGVFNNMSQAAKKLFIRKMESIWVYLNGRKGSTFTGQKRGVKSYKDGKKYHFKKV